VSHGAVQARSEADALVELERCRAEKG